MERAENMARILGVTSNLVLFGEQDLQRQNLLAPLIITGSARSVLRAPRRSFRVEALIDFLALDRDNPSSIDLRCLDWRARTRTRCAGRSPPRCGRR